MVFSVVGDDEAGREVIDDLVALGADTSQVTVSHERPTVRKTRVIAHSQQVVRIDHEDASAVNGPLAAAVAEGLLRELPRADALLVSDYSKGMVTALALDPALAACRATGKVITGDAKPPNFSLLTGATLLTPNEAETSAAAGIAVTDDATLAQAAKRLLTKFAMQALLVTRSERGMSLFTDPERPPLNIPAVASEVYDVTGAGDTVIACATLALAAGADFADAARLANYAAGVVVKKVGAACASPDEIAALMEA
jgi:D-beta-D-heptose 7-phosphate kinase/D-beta-D-heptose 1-phosphate adenosyltransferase